MKSNELTLPSIVVLIFPLYDHEIHTLKELEGGLLSREMSFEAYVRNKIENQRWTHARLSVELQKLFPGRSGLSVHSLKRYN